MIVIVVVKSSHVGWGVMGVRLVGWAVDVKVCMGSAVLPPSATNGA